MKKVALITGITGQTGSFLAEILLDLNYEVHGIIRRNSGGPSSFPNINHFAHKLNLHYGDLADGPALMRITKEVGPDEIYHLGAQSHVRVSFDNPLYTMLINGSGTLNMLEATKALCESKEVRFLHASTSEMFGDVQETPQTENTVFRPRSPYGCSKVYGHYQVINYRESYNMFAVNSICFNHESHRRGPEFVTRKLTLGASRIRFGLQDYIYMGNMDAYRDWGYAPDYAYGLYLILNHSEPEDFVLSTGETHSIREFAQLVFGELGMNYEDYIRVDPKFYRPAEVNLLMGDSSKARTKLGWAPTTSLKDLATIMVDHDLKLAEKEINDRQFQYNN